jgi:hypothetical protein
MSTAQCYRLRDAFLYARSRPTRVIELLGGKDFFSNGIHRGKDMRHSARALDRGGSPMLARPGGQPRLGQDRPSNSAPPPRAGPAVGSKSSGRFAMSVCVVRMSPATEAAFLTAL